MTAGVLTDESERNLASLRRALRRGYGFSLHLVVGELPALLEAQRRLGEWSAAGEVPPLELLGAGSRALAALERLIREAPKGVGGAVLLAGDALSSHDGGRLLEELNLARDALSEQLAGPLVLLLSERGAVELAERTPDFFEVRAGTTAVQVTFPGGDEKTLILLHALGDGARIRYHIDLDEPELDRIPAGALVDRLVVEVLADLAAGRLSEAEHKLDVMRHAAGSIGYMSGILRAEAISANIAQFRGHRNRAREMLEAVAGGAEALSDRRLLALALLDMAGIALAERRYGEAAELLDRARPAIDAAGDADLRSWATGTRALVEASVGNVSLARALGGLALELVPYGHPEFRMRARLVVAETAAATGDLVTARAQFQKALAAARRLGDRRMQSTALYQLGLIRSRLGERSAKRTLTQALERAMECGNEELVEAVRATLESATRRS